jgi:hypothetical protein
MSASHATRAYQKLSGYGRLARGIDRRCRAANENIELVRKLGRNEILVVVPHIEDRLNCLLYLVAGRRWQIFVKAFSIESMMGPVNCSRASMPASSL